MKRLLALVLCAVTAIAGLTLAGNVAAPPAQAISGSEFDPGNIISDDNFYDPHALTQAEVQAFLASKVTCQNSLCLAVARFDSTSQPANPMCAAYPGGPGEPASQIIFKVQQACGISARALLVILQKEQGLITNPAPTDSRIRIAMGYACPDTGSCDVTSYGFFNQVYNAAKQLQRYGNPPGTSNTFTWFPVGTPTAVRYSPAPDCKSPVITIRNKATAALYYYTPYQPNPEALANLYGVGNDCSSYGNRNFWVYYYQWFGNPVASNPIGNIELVAGAPGQVRVAGWALDRDTPGPISVHIYVGPVGTAAAADRERQDVAATYPGMGPNHGFDATVPVTSTGVQDVCVYGINAGPGGTSLLGCRSLMLLGGSPLGALEAADVASDGTATIGGWALDPDVTDPITVHVYVDSVGVAITADANRADVGAKYPGYGNAHGFSYTTKLTPGPHTVCAYGINVRSGGNALLGCRDAVAPRPLTDLNRAPIGSVELVSAKGTEIRAAGWALDPDTAAPIAVHVYVDSAGTATTADRARTDIGRLYPDNGPNHGFDLTVTSTPGTHSVCTYAINNGAGGNSLLGCSTVVVQGSVTEQQRAPIGNFEAATATGGQITAAGWALDPDTVAPIPVHVYVDGAGTPFTADRTRDDIARAYPAYGSSHGFSATVSAAPGTHSVCVYAINNGAGGHTLLGCRTVVVPVTGPDLGRAPVGNLELVSAQSGAVRVAGWAIDPDTADSIAVHIYIDTTGTPTTADRARTDIAAAYPGYGAAHGFDATLPTSAGQHKVCAYGINTGAGGHTLLGCANVTVP